MAGPDDLSPARPVAPIDLTPKLSCPLLGLFGAEDHNPSPEDVARIEDELAHGKTHEFHSYDGAGRALFSVDRPSYNVDDEGRVEADLALVRPLPLGRLRWPSGSEWGRAP